MNASEIVTLSLVHISFIASVLLLIVVLRKSQKSLLRDASVMFMSIMIVWNVGTALDMDYRLITGETVTSTISIMLIDLCYLSVCYVPVVILFLGKVLHDFDWRPELKHISLLIVPTISFMMVCTNPLHSLFFQHFSLYSSEAVYGPYYYVHSIYSYSCILLGLIYIVLSTSRHSGILSKQFFLVLIGIVIPLAGNVLFSFGIANLSFSINSCLFTVATVCFSLAILKYHYITVTPIDMRQVVDLVSDGFLQTNKDKHIVDYNKTLLDLFPDCCAITQNMTIGEFFEQTGFNHQHAKYAEFLHLFEQTIVNQTSVSTEINFSNAQSFIIKITPLYSEGEYSGSVLIFKSDEPSKATEDIGLRKTISEFEKSNRTLNEKLQEGMAQLEEERQASQSLYDSNPHINFIADIDYQVLDGNPSAIKFYGFENKEDFKKGLQHKINQSVLFRMPDGTESIPLTERFEKVLEVGETSFDTVLSFEGVEIPFHFNLKTVPYKGRKVIAVYQTDLRDLRKAESDLERRDKLLSTVNAGASMLISIDSESSAAAFSESFALLGRGCDVDRVTLWQNYEKDGEAYCSQVFEWGRNVDMQHGSAHTMDIKYSDTLPTWEAVLRSGNCVNAIVEDMISVERDQMKRLGIVSMLSAPIFIRDEFWGFVGFDD